MKSFQTLLIFTILILLQQQVMTLKCRSGNQQYDDQFQQILRVCKKRLSGHNQDDNDSSTDENDDDNSSRSEDGTFDKKLFLKNNRYNNNQNSRTQYYNTNNNNYKNGQSSYNMNGGRSYLSNYTTGYQRNGYSRSMNYNMNSNQGRLRNTGMNNENYNSEKDHTCILQCFFNELNVVDRRGFPEKKAVTELMIENIQDPELRDFIEQSISECFQYLGSNTRMDKCDFSQQLASCLADKGRDRCDDWNS
ncbi:general odorant-binding protein 71 [Prorops nasuta]|uniref:general odorant-binding protein 71 n=1 Tax=Prorops nasuta TaxID=863751 RepID=UPI0034CFF292